MSKISERAAKWLPRILLDRDDTSNATKLSDMAKINFDMAKRELNDALGYLKGKNSWESSDTRAERVVEGVLVAGLGVVDVFQGATYKVFSTVLREK